MLGSCSGLAASASSGSPPPFFHGPSPFHPRTPTPRGRLQRLCTSYIMFLLHSFSTSPEVCREAPLPRPPRRNRPFPASPRPGRGLARGGLRPPAVRQVPASAGDPAARAVGLLR